MDKPVIEMLHITKRFSKVVASDDVSLSIGKGEIVALLGENGAGKSTIMKILYGLYRADDGTIMVDGIPQRISSTRDAMHLGISMIQQNFSLVPAHTVTENIILGSCHGVVDYKRRESEISALASSYGFDVPAGERVCNLTVGAQQKVEILKALYRNARVLIMDEPTAVLTPQETERLMDFMRQYAQKGNSVVFITHKMKEVMEVATRIVIMRAGRICGTVKNGDADEASLSRMMIGHGLESLAKPGSGKEKNKVVLSVHDLSIRRKNEPPLLEDLSFKVHEGEVIGFAGVSGNGQQELCEAICGARPITEGSIVLDGCDITHDTIRQRIEKGIGYVVSDRLRYGMVMDMSIEENLLLKESYKKKWRKHGLLDQKKLNRHAEKVISQYSVKAPGPSAPAWSLSGGNQQKVVVAREVEAGSRMIIFDQPTRGLDLGAINYVHKTILNEKSKGKCILLVSTELSEIFTLSDRIVVLYRGRIAGIYKASEVNAEKIGLLMSGYQNGKVKK